MGSNVPTVKGVYDAFAKGDLPAVLGVMDDKIEWIEPANLPFDNQTGPQAVAENIFGRVMTMIPNLTVNPREFIDGGDIVVSLGTYRGQAADTGNELEAEFAHVWRFTDEKVTGFQVLTDTHGWLKALGQA